MEKTFNINDEEGDHAEIIFDKNKVSIIIDTYDSACEYDVIFPPTVREMGQFLIECAKKMEEIYER